MEAGTYLVEIAWKEVDQLMGFDRRTDKYHYSTERQCLEGHVWKNTL